MKFIRCWNILLLLNYNYCLVHNFVIMLYIYSNMYLNLVIIWVLIILLLLKLNKNCTWDIFFLEKVCRLCPNFVTAHLSSTWLYVFFTFYVFCSLSKMKLHNFVLKDNYNIIVLILIIFLIILVSKSFKGLIFCLRNFVGVFYLENRITLGAPMAESSTLSLEH